MECFVAVCLYGAVNEPLPGEVYKSPFLKAVYHALVWLICYEEIQDNTNIKLKYGSEFELAVRQAYVHFQNNKSAKLLFEPVKLFTGLDDLSVSLLLSYIEPVGQLDFDTLLSQFLMSFKISRLFLNSSRDIFYENISLITHHFQ